MDQERERLIVYFQFFQLIVIDWEEDRTRSRSEGAVEREQVATGNDPHCVSPGVAGQLEEGGVQEYLAIDLQLLLL